MASDKYVTLPLTKEFAEQHATELARLADLIPMVTYTEEEILADFKGDRVFYGKWEHSLVIVDGEKPIGLIIGYERKAEENEQYPVNTMYISELAVHEDYQGKGLGRRLLREFIERNTEVGMLYLSGRPCFCVQTNSASWNTPVISLYESFGFGIRAKKVYDNRVDVVMRRS